MITFITIATCLLSAIAIHELGHVIALSLFGYKVKAICLGIPAKPKIEIPIKIREFESKLHLSPYLWSGATIPDMERKPRASIWFIIMLAGALANILCLALIYSIKGPEEFVAVQYPPLTFWSWLIVLNVAYGIGELIPFISSDGTELLKILYGKHTCEIK